MDKKGLMIILLLIMTLLFFRIISSNNEETTKADYDYLVLVNKYTQLPDNWETKLNLVTAKNAWDEEIKLEKEAYEQYKKLAKDLEKDGVIIELDSVYRSVEAQQELWDTWAKDPEKGIDYVKKFVAVPGYSEHHTGLAIDICIRKDGELISDNDAMIAEREIFEKIHAKLANYGFILRYLEGREDSTGYTYEPWHLRYVGSEKIAKEIMDNNLTFEEYLEKETDLVNNKQAAKYQIEKLLQEEFNNDLYKDKISASRFNITKMFTINDEKETLKLGDKDIAFVVVYQIQPMEGVDPKELIDGDGEYDETLGWIKDIHRVGIIRYKDGEYSLDTFGKEF